MKKLEESRKVSANLRENEKYLRSRLENCSDILIRPMRLGDKHKVDCLMVYIEVAVSNMMLDDSALGKMINHFWEISPEDIQEFVRHNSLGIADVKKLENLDESIDAMLAGNAVFFIDGYDKAMKISSKGYPSTGVMEAESEKVLRGSREGFSDSVKSNSALVRKRLRDTRLKVEEYKIGVRSHTLTQVLYMDDLVHEGLLEEVKERLEEFQIDGILDSGMLEQLTEDVWYSPFPQYQKIIALVAKDMKDRGRLDGNTAVVTVMSNLGFMKYMQSIGIDTARTAVGDRYVLEEMRARGYAIGGEQSGHVIFLHHSTTGDGELTAGKLLKLLARKHREEGTKMSELNAVYTKFPQVLINLTADKEQKQAYKEDEYIAGFIESQQQNLMGMGRVLVRVSGTEPKIRVMVEGEDMEAIQSSAERIADMIRQRIPGVC